MRQQLLHSDSYSPEQKQLADIFHSDISKYLSSFTTATKDGELIGPFNIMLHQPDLGTAAWKLFTALNDKPKLATAPHEIAILVTGARYGCLYELYSHESVSAEKGMPLAKIATIAAGERPNDLSTEEAVAYDVAAVLNRGHQIPDSTYRAAIEAFGERGLAELVYAVGCYSVICVLLNAFDVALPGTERGYSLPGDR